jgi:hypothetical protein
MAPESRTRELTPQRVPPRVVREAPIFSTIRFESWSGETLLLSDDKAFPSKIPPSPNGGPSLLLPLIC